MACRKSPAAIISINCNLFTGKVNIKIEFYKTNSIFQFCLFFFFFFVFVAASFAHTITFVVRMHFTRVHCRCTFCAANESIGRWWGSSRRRWCSSATITIILNGWIVTVWHFETFTATRKAPLEFNVGRIGIHSTWYRYWFLNGCTNNCYTWSSAHRRIYKYIERERGKENRASQWGG